MPQGLGAHGKLFPETPCPASPHAARRRHRHEDRRRAKQRLRRTPFGGDGNLSAAGLEGEDRAHCAGGGVF